LYFSALIFPLIPPLPPDGIPYQGNRLRHMADNFVYSLYGLRFSQGEMHPMWTTENCSGELEIPQASQHGGYHGRGLEAGWLYIQNGVQI
jgi:hypothetical protein